MAKKNKKNVVEVVKEMFTTEETVIENLKETKEVVAPEETVDNVEKEKVVEQVKKEVVETKIDESKLSTADKRMLARLG